GGKKSVFIRSVRSIRFAILSLLQKEAKPQKARSACPSRRRAVAVIKNLAQPNQRIVEFADRRAVS
ncbi:MAG TPA: hypothetical protein PLC89_21090, partial [Haliscomenobacter sp.]|uniref:hypothetical protein n=1 Tax=Haliscomenobacter sp. TaxID=2717303 RepID=UPI002C68A8A4